MPYFFGRREGDRFVIEGSDARHLARSLRARPGETVEALDPPASRLTVRLDSVAADRVAGAIVAEARHLPEPAARVTVAIALLPGAALDEALGRCTELGASAFLLVQAARSVSRVARPERWHAICREAAMLAGRFQVPEVAGPVPFDEAWASAREPWLLDREAPRTLAALTEPRDLTLFIGPEGGWAPHETSAAGERRLTLGPRNLRAPNAAAAALAVALSLRP